MTLSDAKKKIEKIRKKIEKNKDYENKFKMAGIYKKNNTSVHNDYDVYEFPKSNSDTKTGISEITEDSNTSKSYLLNSNNQFNDASIMVNGGSANIIKQDGEILSILTCGHVLKQNGEYPEALVCIDYSTTTLLGTYENGDRDNDYAYTKIKYGPKIKGVDFKLKKFNLNDEITIKCCTGLSYVGPIKITDGILKVNDKIYYGLTAVNSEHKSVSIMKGWSGSAVTQKKDHTLYINGLIFANFEFDIYKFSFINNLFNNNNLKGYKYY